MFGSVGRLVGTNTKSSELVFSGLLDSLCKLLPASVIFESSVATAISKYYLCIKSISKSCTSKQLSILSLAVT